MALGVVACACESLNYHYSGRITFGSVRYAWIKCLLPVMCLYLGVASYGLVALVLETRCCILFVVMFDKKLVNWMDGGEWSE